jgi:hypothetical protein
VQEIAVVQFYEGKEQVDFGNVSYLIYDNYVAHMKELLSHAQRIGELKMKGQKRREKVFFFVQTFSFCVFVVGGGSGAVYLLLYGDGSSYSSIAKFFKIWTHPRSHFQYLQVCWIYYVVAFFFLLLLLLLPCVCFRSCLSLEGTCICWQMCAHVRFCHRHCGRLRIRS